MTVRPDRVGVALKDGSDGGIASATSPGGVLDGLSFVRRLTDHAAVFEGPGAASLVDRDWSGTEVQYAVPVFVPVGGGVDAVALDEVIVALNGGTTAAEFFTDQRFAGYRPLIGSSDQFVAKLAGGQGQATVDLADDLAVDKRVAWAEPDFYQDWQKYYIPNDPRFGNAWHHVNTGQGTGGVVDQDTDTDLAWDIVPGGSPSLLFGIVDDGLDISHPDLRIWTNPGEVPDDRIDNDGNGFVDDINGWNFVNNNNVIIPQASNDNHGTSVAGVAAARGDNGIGVAGGSYNAAVFSARIFSGTSIASDSGFASAIRYAAGINSSGSGNFAFVDLANHSWGGGSSSAAITSAFNIAGTLGRGGLGTISLVASGNDPNGAGVAISYPGNLTATEPSVVAVGATNNRGTRSNYSNYGAALDIVAPSNDQRTNYLAIDTTDRVGTVGYNTNTSTATNSGDYTGTGSTGFGGTSSATPHSSGITGLVLTRGYELGVNFTPTQLKTYLRSATDLIGGVAYSITTGKHNEYGFGRINAFTAVNGVGKPVASVTTTTTDVTGGSAVPLGNVTLGSSATLTLRVRNQGTLPLTISSLATTGPFSVETGFGAGTLGMGGATTFQLRFTPTDAGAATGTATFTTNDPSRPVVTLNLTGTGLGRSITGKAFEDWNGDGARQPTEPVFGGATVFLDANGNGLFDGASTTTSAAFLAIPDNNATGVTASQTLAGLTGTITDVDVTVNVPHTYDQELRLSLISPAGTEVTLVANRGGSGDNFTATIFDDAATTSITGGTAPFTGRFRPETPLSGLNGQSPNGLWRLKAVDNATGDFGFIQDWTLTLKLSSPEQSAVAASDGTYFFDNLSAGTYAVRALGNAGTVSTGSQTVVVASGSTAANVDVGAARNNRVYGRAFNDANDNGNHDPGEAGLAGRMAFLDLDGNGALEASTGSFTNSTALAIPDNNVAGIASNLAVSGLAGPITDLDVTINITHTYDGDLRLSLVSPTGIRIPLAWRRGGSGDNYTATIFDDAAVNAVSAGTAPFTGRFRPETPLAALNGVSPNGTWQLVVADTVAQDTGTLNNWTLTFAVGEPRATSDAQGNFAFDVAAGAFSLRMVQAAGSRPTTPAAGLYNVIAAGAPIVERAFGFIPDAIAPALPSSGGFLVNGGGDQRSLVENIRIEFTERVVFSGPATAAFELAGPAGAIPFTATIDDTGPRTVVTLSFTGLDTDANYSLTVNNGQIRDLAQNAMAAAGPQAFFRLLGDLTGDRTVDFQDFLVFRGQLGLSLGNAGYLPASDLSPDNTVDFADFLVFRGRLGASLAP